MTHSFSKPFYRNLWTLSKKKHNVASKIRDSWAESAYSVDVRSGWHRPNDIASPEEFAILLAGGGPACRIYGTFDKYINPDSAYIQYQDWFTPWEDLFPITDEEQDALLEFASCFYNEE